MVWKRWTRNLGAKLLSFVVAAALWFSVTNEIEFERAYRFPVEYVNKPAGLTTLERLPTEVTANVRGKGKFLYYKLRGGYCRVDLAGYQVGQNRISFTGQEMVLPNDVEVARVEVLEPRRVVVEFDETVIRDIPITPTIQGEPSERYTQVGKTLLSPPMARVKGPRSLVDEITLLPTAEIDIRNARSSLRKSVRLEGPPSSTVEITPMTVDIGITIEPVRRELVDGVALEVASSTELPGELAFRPASLALEVEGAQSIVEAAAREMSSIVVRAEEWSIGTSVLEFRETREGALVFVPIVVGPVAEANNSVVFGESDEVLGPDPAPLPVAVTGEVLAAVPLPREVRVLGVQPQRLVVVVSDRREQAMVAPAEGAPATEDSPELAP